MHVLLHNGEILTKRDGTPFEYSSLSLAKLGKKHIETDRDIKLKIEEKK